MQRAAPGAPRRGTRSARWPRAVRPTYNAGVISAERFATGMTFDEYLSYAGSPGNLTREAGWWLGRERRDLSGGLRAWYTRMQLSAAQMDAIRWLAFHPDGPARLLVISEEWSSDCRRDVPSLARLAEAGGLELRIFPRDGQKLGHGPRADPAESPTADIVNEFLNEKDGQTFQSVPVAAFFTRDMRHLYTYFEYPAIYHKERLAAAMQVPRPGESREQAWPRFIRDWGALQHSPFFFIWASAAIDEILSALHERIITGESG